MAPTMCISGTPYNCHMYPCSSGVDNCYVYLWHGITIPPRVPGVPHPSCSALLARRLNALNNVLIHCIAVHCITLLSQEGPAFGSRGHTSFLSLSSLSFAREGQLLEFENTLEFQVGKHKHFHLKTQKFYI